MNNQRVLFGTNWKMHKTMQEAVDYICRLLELLQTTPGIEQAQVFVIPPFTAIEAVRRASAGKLWIGAQNMHWAEWGAYTGEISAPMLVELGVDLVELGHAERRRYFNETDAEVNCKVHSALRHGLRPMICVGEQTEDKEFGVAQEALSRQIRMAMRGVESQQASSLIIAYEPVWSIGRDAASASPDYVRTMREYIRGILGELFGPETSDRVPVIYGGDVNVSNCAALLTEGKVDGLFVGRAGRQADAFANLIRISLQAVNPALRSLDGNLGRRLHDSQADQ
jgi:triosephosphate isomerase